MTIVYVNPDEPIDRAFRRFKKQVEKEGLRREMRRRTHYEKPSEKRRRRELKRIRQIRRVEAKLAESAPRN